MIASFIKCAGTVMIRYQLLLRFDWMFIVTYSVNCLNTKVNYFQKTKTEKFAPHTKQFTKNNLNKKEVMYTFLHAMVSFNFDLSVFIISFYHSPYNNVINVLPKKKVIKKPN